MPPRHEVAQPAPVRLRRCRPKPGADLPRFELDLRDVAAEVVYAWLRYLYTHDDLSVVWPCEGQTAEETLAGEQFWMELLLLAQRLGDNKLRMYTEDMLVGTVSADNWADMALFAERAQCTVLSEAALMAGVRRLIPGLLSALKVPTGFEPLAKKVDEPGEVGDSGAVGEQAATVGRSGAGQQGLARATVELELERQLSELRGVSAAAVFSLRRSSALQFAELKRRLADSISNAQRVGVQLHRSVQFYDKQAASGSRSIEFGRSFWLEFVLLAMLVTAFLVPNSWRQTAYKLLPTIPQWLKAYGSHLDLSWLLAIFPGGLRVLVINFAFMSILFVIVWWSIKS